MAIGEPREWYVPDEMKLAELEEYVRRRARVDVCLIQNGSFFDAYNESAHILHSELGFENYLNQWQVRTVGFPVSSREKNLKRLEEGGISYAVVEQDGEGWNGRMARVVTRVFRPGSMPTTRPDASARSQPSSDPDVPNETDLQSRLGARARRTGLTLAHGRAGEVIICSEDGAIVARVPPDSEASLDWHVIQADKRLRFPRHGSKWSSDEDELLRRRFATNPDIDALSGLHQRTLGGIRSRLIKLGLIGD